MIDGLVSQAVFPLSPTVLYVAIVLSVEFVILALLCPLSQVALKYAQ